MKHLIIKYATESKAIAAQQHIKTLDPAISMNCFLDIRGDSLAFQATDCDEAGLIERLAKETGGEVILTENF